MANIVADNIDVVIRTARNGTARTITFKDLTGVSYIQGIEIHNAEDPTTVTIPARVSFNRDDNAVGTKYRTIRPGGSYAVDARIRNIVIIGVGGDADLEISFVW